MISRRIRQTIRDCVKKMRAQCFACSVNVVVNKTYGTTVLRDCRRVLGRDHDEAEVLQRGLHQICCSGMLSLQSPFGADMCAAPLQRRHARH